ncbi:hypothetical protein EDD15DRAFT_2522072 [Pisolithus albus]|nr:hypothetical protein EDD15DRAFT_2522072 [Pisolithus albus]
MHNLNGIRNNNIEDESEECENLLFGNFWFGPKGSNVLSLQMQHTQHICWRHVLVPSPDADSYPTRAVGLDAHIPYGHLTSDAFTGPPQPCFRTLSPVNLHPYLYAFVSGTCSGWNGLPVSGEISVIN